MVLIYVYIGKWYEGILKLCHVQRKSINHKKNDQYELNFKNIYYFKRTFYGTQTKNLDLQSFLHKSFAVST